MFRAIFNRTQILVGFGKKETEVGNQASLQRVHRAYHHLVRGVLDRHLVSEVLRLRKRKYRSGRAGNRWKEVCNTFLSDDRVHDKRVNGHHADGHR